MVWIVLAIILAFVVGIAVGAIGCFVWIVGGLEAAIGDHFGG